MINDIHYGIEQRIGNQSTQKGKKLGEVQYQVADNVTCAAFLQEGTEIYEIQGYSEKFRVMAGSKVYQLRENHMIRTFERSIRQK